MQDEEKSRPYGDFVCFQDKGKPYGKSFIKLHSREA